MKQWTIFDVLKICLKPDSVLVFIYMYYYIRSNFMAGIYILIDNIELLQNNIPTFVNTNFSPISDQHLLNV